MTKLTPEQVEKLEAAAKKATKVQPCDLMRYEHGGGRLAVLRDGQRNLVADFFKESDREHYANCDPQTILTLCREWREMHEAYERLDQWAQAYPLDIFPEPDFKKAAKVLKDNGMTIDAISASNMRHVITRVMEILAALKGADHDKD